MAVWPQSVTYRDNKGQTSTMRFYVSEVLAADALLLGQGIVDALDDLTNAANNGARGAYTTAPSAVTYGADADYETVEDKAVLTFKTATGSLHRYQVPAPLETIFREDTETVKTPNGAGDAQEILLNTLVVAMVGNACSRDGAPITGYVGGTRLRRKIQRKFNIFTQNPDITGPGL